MTTFGFLTNFAKKNKQTLTVSSLGLTWRSGVLVDRTTSNGKNREKKMLSFFTIDNDRSSSTLVTAGVAAEQEVEEQGVKDKKKFVRSNTVHKSSKNHDNGY